MKEMLTHLKICMGAKKAGIKKDVLGLYRDEELDDFFREIERLELVKCIETLNRECVKKLIKETGFCQILQWLLEEGAELKRIQSFLCRCKELNPSANSYVALRNVLLDEEVPEDYLYEYWKYYRKEVTETEAKKRLWNGLQFYHDRTEQSVELLTEKERKCLLYPVFSSCLFYRIQDMQQIFSAFEKEGFTALVQILTETIGTVYTLEPEAFRQLVLEPERIKEELWQVLHIIPPEQGAAFGVQWLENQNLLYDLRKLAYILPKMDSGIPETLWQSRVAYIGLLYKTPTQVPFEGLPRHAEDLLIYAIIHKKRHFLKIAEKYREKFLHLPYYSMLGDRDFYQRFVNLNTLNEKELLDSMEYRSLETEEKRYMENAEYTFEEIRCFYGQKPQYIQFYHFLTDARVDRRLRVFREIIKKQCLPEDMDTQQMECLGEKLTEKKLSVWLEKDFAHIQGLRPDTAVQLLLYQKNLDRFLAGIQSEPQAQYVLRNLERLTPFADMEEFNQSLLETEETWKRMKEDFALSEEFVEENRNRILQFLHKGGAEIMTAFYGSNKDAKEKARRLVTAELMGRFKELKYHKGDLSKEISFVLTDVQKETWLEKEEMNRTDGISVWEEERLLPVIQIGETPTKTCMSYFDGKQKECLLSCFDANKKVIFASWYGQIIFRTILRLTKGRYLSERKDEGSKQEIEFADILAEEKEDKEPEDLRRKERLVLFLERPYHKGLSPEQLRAVMREVLCLAERKAEKLGAEFVVNKQYAAYLSGQKGFVTSSFYLYISKSKNGRQYLDSLGGNASVSDAGNYRNGIFLVKENLEEKNAA